MKFSSDLQSHGQPTPNEVHQVLVGVLRHDAYMRGLLNEQGGFSPEAISSPAEFLLEIPARKIDLNAEFSSALQKFRFESGVNGEDFAASLRLTLAHSSKNHAELQRDLKWAHLKQAATAGVKSALDTIGLGRLMPQRFVERLTRIEAILKLKLHASACEQAVLSSALENLKS